MKKTLLEIVQNILSDMTSEEINSIADSVEALQVASIVEDTYYNIIAAREEIHEHKELIKLTALSDNLYPTHFNYPTNVKEIEKVWYDTSDDGSYKYTTVYWKDPLDFICLVDAVGENYDSVSDKNAGTNLRIRNDKQPYYYTSFDDNYIVMDSYDSSIDSTLQQSKVRAYGTVYPTFSQTDSFTPDLDNTLFPYLLAEAKSTAMSLLKGGTDPKVEQAARRLKSFQQNNMYKTKQANSWSNYGRR